MTEDQPIDPDVIETAHEVGGEQIDKAKMTLQARNERERQNRLLDLFGKLDWDPAFNHKSERDRD